MDRKRHVALGALTALALPFSALGSGTALTIYSTAAPGAIPPERYRPLPNVNPYAYNPYQQQPIPGYAVVRQDRQVEFVQGRGELSFSGVAALLDPTTVRFESLSDPAGTRVLEQDYRFDVVSQQKLLERYLNQQISVDQVLGDRVETITGTLLGATGGLMIRTPSGQIRTLTSYSNVQYPALPGGLLTRPTLVWDVFSNGGGEQDTRVSYQTSGITWWADYNVIFEDGSDANSGLLDVGAWVSIINQSGATYEDAKLKLVAGDVQRAPQANGYMYADGLARREAASKANMPAGFEQKSFFEYHLYTLGRPTTLPENSTKQLELFEPARSVPVDKVMVYYGLPVDAYSFAASPYTDRDLGVQSNTKVDIYLRFENRKRDGLGVPLPSGRIRVSKRDAADGALEFIGEDVIDHTPRDESVLIRLGSAFDVVGERKQMDFRVDYNRHWMEEDIEISIRNHKDEPVEVLIKENLYRWVNWQIIRQSHEHEKIDSRTVHFPIQVAPDGEITLRYTVRYTW